MTYLQFLVQFTTVTVEHGKVQRPKVGIKAAIKRHRYSVAVASVWASSQLQPNQQKKGF